MVILVLIMVVAIAGSLYGVFNQITGYATTGIVNVTIAATASLTVNSNVQFGSGTIASAEPLTQLGTEATNQYGDFNNCSSSNGGVSDTQKDCMGLEIENNGNVHINVTMLASTDINTFFNSTSDVGANFTFAVIDGNRSKNETAVRIMGVEHNNSATLLGGIGGNASCLYNGNVNLSISPKGTYINTSFINWTLIPTSTAYLICANLSFQDKNDTITVEFNLTIPGDEPTGDKRNTFTFTGTQLA